MIINKMLQSTTAVLFLTLAAQGAQIFSDDFSNCGQSAQNWVALSDSLVRTCSAGEYAISNKDRNYAGLLVHTFNNPKPSTFTLSGKITRASDTVAAGFYVCLSVGTTASGYAVQLNRVPWIQLMKYANGTPTSLFVRQSAYVVAGSNTVAISKKADTINVFCNGQFVYSSVDPGSLAGGDIAVVVPSRSSAVFDNILVTDQFTPRPQERTWFVDDFSGSVLSGWLDYGTGEVLQVNGGFLKIQTYAANARAYPYISPLTLGDSFVAQTIVQHRHGSSSALYGIFLSGEPAGGGGNIPMAFFAIRGDKKGASFVSGDSVRPAVSTSIRGAAYVDATDSTFYWDTLEINKGASGPYRMIVNHNQIDSIPAASVKFTVTAAGIFLDQGVEVWDDYFYIAKDNTAVLNPAKRMKAFRYSRFSPQHSAYLVDPLGRIVRANDFYGSQTFRTLAPGYYVTPEGKKGILIKK